MTAIGLAFLSNIGFKLGLIGTSGGMDMLRRCLPGLLSTAVGAAAVCCCSPEAFALLELRAFPPPARNAVCVATHDRGH